MSAILRHVHVNCACNCATSIHSVQCTTYVHKHMKTRSGETMEKELALLGECAYFGEQGLGTIEVTRTASVSAVVKSSCYVLEMEPFQSIVWPVIQKGLFKIVKQVPLLRTLRDHEMNMLVRGMCLRTFPADVPIITEGAIGSEFFILQSGRVRVTTSADGIEKELALLESGSYFGERAMVKKEKRNATVTALEACVCFCLSEDQFCHTLLPHARGAFNKQVAVRRLLYDMEWSSDEEDPHNDGDVNENKGSGDAAGVVNLLQG